MHENTKFDLRKKLLYEIVERKYNISREQILSIGKTRLQADTRRVIIRILKNSFPDTKVKTLGRAVARNHSSVSIQLKEHNKLYNFNQEYTELFNTINSEYNSLTNSNKPLSELYVFRDGLKTKLEIVNKAIDELECKTRTYT